jgi:hypothetical protein
MAVQLTLSEASEVLQPPMTETQLRMIICALRWRPDGKRHNGRPGHPVATYSAARIFTLHAALAPWLTLPYAKPQPTGLSETKSGAH